MIDWRSNRLVDILAKQGASINAPPEHTVKLLKSAVALVKARAAKLGEATFHSNNCMLPVVDENGDTKLKPHRDSVPRPKVISDGKRNAKPCGVKPCKPRPIDDSAKAWTPEQPPSKRARVLQQNRRRKNDAEAQVHAALDRIALQSVATTTSDGESAFDRIRKRVKVSSL